MRAFVRIREREPRDAQERVALLRHRLESIKYRQALSDEGALAYAFVTADTDEGILMYEQPTLEALDWHLKRDPHFGYTVATVIPVVSTEALVREAQSYLGEELFNESELRDLEYARRKIDPDGEYWLAWKEVPPFSPLLAEDDQNDIYRRTILAQRSHLLDLEFADDNPVGRPIGILIAEADLEATRRHVESCEVFPDTVVTYTRLLTLRQAWRRTTQQLERLRPWLAVPTWPEAQIQSTGRPE